MNFKKYRKKPVDIKATILTNDLWNELYPEGTTINRFILKPITYECNYTDGINSWPQEEKAFLVQTLEDHKDLHRGEIGDYLIQGVQGEIYACKPDIFEQTYEFVDDSYIQHAI